MKPFILVIPRGFSSEESAAPFRRDDFFPQPVWPLRDFGVAAQCDSSQALEAPTLDTHDGMAEAMPFQSYRNR